nr:putative B3 domain-containing protein At1g78640 [Ipomoea batatas]
MAADKSVSTDLGLSLHPSPGISRSQEGRPGVDLCPSIWGFNAAKKPDQEPLLPALPNPQDFTFTLLSSSTLSKPSSVLILIPVSARIGDFLPDKKQRVEGDDGHWIKKRLSLSDVNDSSRLLLDKEDVKKHVLALMDEERSAACESLEGLRVKMWDLDTGSEHELSLKKWQTGSFLLTSNWSKEFVRRRNLQFRPQRQMSLLQAATLSRISKPAVLYQLCSTISLQISSESHMLSKQNRLRRGGAATVAGESNKGIWSLYGHVKELAEAPSNNKFPEDENRGSSPE